MTRRGAGLTIAGAVLTTVGVWLRYPEIAALGAAALAAVLAAFAAGLLPARLTVVRTAAPAVVMRDGTCEATLTVRNDARWWPVTVAGADRCRTTGGEQRIPVPPARLRPGATATVRYPVPTERRGLVRLGPLSLGRSDPFGLAAFHGPAGTVSVVAVHPRLHPVRVRLPGAAPDPDGAGARGPHGAVSADLLRGYRPGDDLRQVHWRTSARAGALVVRERAGTGRAPLRVLLDDRAEVHDGDTFEAACEAAASVVVAALRDGAAVRLSLASGAVVPEGRAVAEYLGALARACPHPATGAVPAAHGAWCFTGRPDAARLGAVAAAAVIVLFGPAPPAAGARPRIVAARDAADFARRCDGERP
ncbi:DUF58 domain-containing protein [Dactylosporangium sp. AC04546]|uniref:DUF58 domain-containing protein n=1 Tax=Dactylosporangium sp. AC04546 TaxID=2862460 RepID=UPI001EDD1C04|nr:DUF58 domain-containing protein [Dactylosporangium sp. AC04546]WVK89056.1 DUF58 domain-containing protein [Dactylosporangium sp. AC04546]